MLFKNATSANHVANQLSSSNNNSNNSKFNPEDFNLAITLIIIASTVEKQNVIQKYNAPHATQHATSVALWDTRDLFA